jgi:hypothetical protein
MKNKDIYGPGDDNYGYDPKPWDAAKYNPKIQIQSKIDEKIFEIILSHLKVDIKTSDMIELSKAVKEIHEHYMKFVTWLFSKDSDYFIILKSIKSIEEVYQFWRENIKEK